MSLLHTSLFPYIFIAFQYDFVSYLDLSVFFHMQERKLDVPVKSILQRSKTSFLFYLLFFSIYTHTGSSKLDGLLLVQNGEKDSLPCSQNSRSLGNSQDSLQSSESPSLSTVSVRFSSGCLIVCLILGKNWSEDSRRFRLHTVVSVSSLYYLIVEFFIYLGHGICFSYWLLCGSFPSHTIALIQFVTSVEFILSLELSFDFFSLDHLLGTQFVD